MHFQLFLVALATSVSAGTRSALEVVNNDVYYGRAASLFSDWKPYTADLTKCLKANGYQAVFIRGLYAQADGNGTFDTNSVASIRNAYAVGLGPEIFMRPAQNGHLKGGQQLDMMIRRLSDNGIVIRSVWLQVSTMDSWSTDTVSNIAYISSVITRANQLGIIAGIKTYPEHWRQITNNWNVGPNVLLWYYPRTSPPSYTGTPNFDDFVEFGGFESPLVKEWSVGGDQECSYNINRNVYAIGISAKKSSFIFPDEKIVVGGIGL